MIPRPKNCVIMATGSLGLGCSAEGDGTDLLYQAQGVVAAPSLHELAAFYSVYAEASNCLTFAIVDGIWVRLLLGWWVRSRHRARLLLS